MSKDPSSGYVVVAEGPLRCPKCGNDENLFRIEQVYVLSGVRSSKEEPGYEHDGCSKALWETQEHNQEDPEFRCQWCDLEFDWVREVS